MILCAILASCNILSYLTNLYIMYDMSTLPVVPVNMRPHKSSFNISPGFCIESFILRIISQSFVLQRKPSSFTVSTSAPFLSRINVFHSLAWLNFCIFFFFWYSLIESKMLGLFILTVIKILVSCVD